MSIRVIRVGGSLLTWNSFVPSFRRWLKSQPPARSVLFAGGGPWIELNRQAAKRFDLTEEAAHWVCVRTLQTTADLVRQLFNAQLTSDFAELRQGDTRGENQLIVFDVYDFLRQDEKRSDSLPANWDVTSDSIAARLAHRLEADELVLLKSTSPPEPKDPQSLADSGYVDRYFPIASKPLKTIRYVNLRA